MIYMDAACRYYGVRGFVEESGAFRGCQVDDGKIEVWIIIIGMDVVVAVFLFVVFDDMVSPVGFGFYWALSVYYGV